MVAVAFWDAVFASIAYLFVLPVLAIMVSPVFLLAYLVDAPVMLVPVLVLRRCRRSEAVKAMQLSQLLRVAHRNGGFMLLSALFREFVLGRPLLVYEKGH